MEKGVKIEDKEATKTVYMSALFDNGSFDSVILDLFRRIYKSTQNLFYEPGLPIDSRQWNAPRKNILRNLTGDCSCCCLFDLR